MALGCRDMGRWKAGRRGGGWRRGWGLGGFHWSPELILSAVLKLPVGNRASMGSGRVTEPVCVYFYLCVFNLCILCVRVYAHARETTDVCAYCVSMCVNGILYTCVHVLEYCPCICNITSSPLELFSGSSAASELSGSLGLGLPDTQ